MHPVRVESWLELQECLSADSWHRELHHHRSNVVFRGESDAANALAPASTASRPG